MYRCSARIVPVLMIAHGFLFPHYTIEYRKHFTHFHSTVVETAGGIEIGQTEAFFVYTSICACFAYVGTYTMTNVIDV